MDLNIAARQWRDEQGRMRRCHYFLTVDLEKTSRFCLENYGVRIVEEDGEEAAFPRLTTSASEADRLMTRLVDHQVGPTGLRDVVDDWLTLTSALSADPASAAASPAGR